jgi:hypothetical protein
VCGEEKVAAREQSRVSSSVAARRVLCVGGKRKFGAREQQCVRACRGSQTRSGAVCFTYVSTVCSGLYGTVWVCVSTVCSGLYWTVWVYVSTACSGLYWTVWVCVSTVCSGLYWTVCERAVAAGRALRQRGLRACVQFWRTVT